MVRYLSRLICRYLLTNKRSSNPSNVNSNRFESRWTLGTDLCSKRRRTTGSRNIRKRRQSNTDTMVGRRLQQRTQGGVPSVFEETEPPTRASTVSQKHPSFFFFFFILSVGFLTYVFLCTPFSKDASLDVSMRRGFSTVH